MQVEEIKPEETISLKHVEKPEEEKPEKPKPVEVEEVRMNNTSLSGWNLFLSVYRRLFREFRFSVGLCRRCYEPK